MSTSEATDEVAVAAWLCANLAALAQAAQRHRWSPKLNAVLEAIRSGTAPSVALAAQHIPVNAVRAGEREPDRGMPATLANLGIDPIAIVGDYTCPAPTLNCGRRAHHDVDTGHEPRCGIFDRTMAYEPRRSQS